MLPRADITGTRPLAPVEAPAPVNASGSARQEVQQRLTQIAIGSRLQAEVLSQLNDGTFLVRLTDTTVRMNLPAGTQVGDTLSMTMLATEPRPTLLLEAASDHAATTLSSTGRLIDNLLRSAEEQGSTSTIAGKTPLTASAAALLSEPAASQLTTTLRNALQFSGVFYESHLQEWVSGERPLTDVMKEPQASDKTLQMSARTATPLNADITHTDLIQLINQLRDSSGSTQSALHLLRDAQLQSSQPHTDVDTVVNTSRLAPSSPEATQLINQQLNTLEQKQVMWQGELFPGQSLEWAIKEDTTPRKDAEDEPSSSWQSSVRFDLPNLGAVSATIHLVGEHVHVRVSTETEEAATSLRAHGDELADALGAAGAPLDSLLVKQDEKRDSLQNAVALAYQTGDKAPKVVARGRGLIAEEIIARAREHGVHVHESSELVALLMQVELDRHIPPTLYRVVAELLAWLYRIEAGKSIGDKKS